MENYKIGVGNQKLYDNYDKNLTKRLENKLLEINVDDKLKSFDDRTVFLLKRRYFKNDEDGNILEDVPKMFARISSNIAYADIAYGASEEKAYESARIFYDLMTSMDFMPNSPTIMNAGGKLQQLSACFVLPIKDDMDSILGTQKDAGIVHKSGGGTGFDWSELRMANDIVSSTYGLSSGPVRFLGAYDATTHAVNQGGTRRGANMGMMRVDHADVIQFINEKTIEGNCANFNLSVSITDDFMKHVENDSWYTLYNPKKGEINPVTKKDLEKIMTAVNFNKISLGDVNFRLDENGKPIENIAGLSARFNEKEELQLKATDVFNYIANSAWKLGEPGVIFIDKINKYNPTPHLGEMRSTNPCGEQPLLPYEACNLGSINLAKFVKDGKIDKKRLEKVTRDSVHFLDNVIDMSKFPLEKIVNMVHQTRKIGLGVMGWADALIEMKMAYDSQEAIELARETMKFVNDIARDESIELAKERGVFPAFKGSVYEGGEPMRNATRTTIAPTGTISQIAGHTSSSIEPIFNVIYTHTDADGNKSPVVSPTIKRDLENSDLSDLERERIFRELKEGKKINQISNVPPEILRIYKTSGIISAKDHIMMQAAFQEYVDNAVSKTINLPFEATREDVKNSYLLAYKLGCKGVTVYRDKSREHQILTSGLEEKVEEVVLIDVELGSKAIKEGHDAKYYNIKKGEDTFHVMIVGDFWENDKKQIYLIPSKVFQNTKPLGREESTEFAQSGLDRTGRLKSDNPDWAEMIKEWKSVTGDKIQGIGPTRINSPSHGVGLAFEHYCLSRGIVEYDEKNNLQNAIKKKELIKIEDEERIKQIKKKLNNGNGKSIEHKIYDNIDEKFECQACHSTKHHKESGCSDPVCNQCGWSIGKCG
jgi:ribonucleoside-diphosphate reductase alpha chain